MNIIKEKPRCNCCTKPLTVEELKEAAREVKSGKLAHYYCNDCFQTYAYPNEKYTGLGKGESTEHVRGEFEFPIED